MLFAEMMQHLSGFQATAMKIVAIFDEEGALNPQVSNTFYFDDFSFDANQAPDEIGINCSAWWGDEKDHRTIYAPHAWLDAFDESTVRAAAKEAVAKRQREKQENEQRQAALRREREIKELRALQEKYPDATSAGSQ